MDTKYIAKSIDQVVKSAIRHNTSWSDAIDNLVINDAGDEYTVVRDWTVDGWEDGHYVASLANEEGDVIADAWESCGEIVVEMR
jgi:hypothetical protein